MNISKNNILVIFTLLLILGCLNNSGMKKIFLPLILLCLIGFEGWSQTYNWDRFGQGNVTMTVNSPVNGIISNTTQASGSSTYYLIEADGYWNKWSNTSTPYNQVFTAFWGGGSYNGADGVLNSGTVANKFYTLQIDGAGYSNRQAIIMETDNSPIGFDGTTPVSPSSPIVYPEQDLDLTITLSGNKSSQEIAFVRYSDNGFSSSQVAQVSFSSSTASSGTAIIPGSFNTAGKSVAFYVYTTTVSANSSSNHDLITLDLANNSGSNYSYTVQSSWTTSGISSNFNNASAWDAGEVPPSGQPLTIENNLSLNTDYNASSVIINSGQTLTVNSGQTLTISGGITGPGNLTINGGLQINSGGYTDIAPTYGSSSTLIYNSGATYGRASEWSSTTGAGYPNNVDISNNTTLDLSSGGSVARQIAGILTINSGSSLSMGSMGASLTVLGNITNSGTLTLSTAVGGDLFIGGNLSNSGTLNHNTRLIKFNGSGQQTLSSPLNVDYFEVNNAAGIILNASLTVGVNFNLANGVIDLQGGSITVSSGGSITGGSSSSYVKTSGTHGLVQAVGGSAVIFPVGNSSYNPLTISNTGTTDNFTVIVEDQVLADGTTGPAQTANAIGRSWNISEATPGGSDATITVQWSSSDELTGFDPTACFISHYHQAPGWSSEGWKPGATVDVSHSDPRTITLSNLSSFSPFGVGSAGSPLPVELQSFHVVEKGNLPSLEWVTLSEINSAHFEVQTSIDAKEWKAIHKESAAGNSNQERIYRFVDEYSSINDFIYYRLKQVDLDGSFTYTNVVKYEQEKEYNQVKVFPNPTKGVFNLQFSEIASKTIRVRNSMGVIVEQIQIGGQLQTQLDLTSQPKGIYFIEVMDNYNSKFIPLMISR